MYRFLLVTALMLGLGFAASAQAGADEAWRVVQSAGDVRVTTAADATMIVDPRTELPEGAIVTTDKNGRVVIRRGEEQVILQPLTRLVLTRATPGATNILQSAGSALYRIGKKKTPHFQVDTPYLAALVKGTAFTVTVNRTRADVMVTEGAVEVSSREGSAVSLLKTGMTASVNRADTRAIDLQERSGTHRLVTTNEGGWSGTGSTEGPQLRTGTGGDTGPQGMRTNLSGLRDGTVGVELASATDHEALRLSASDAPHATSQGSAEFPDGAMLRQSTLDDLATTPGSGKPLRGNKFGAAVEDAASAISGKVDSAVKSMARRKPLKVTASFPWNAMAMCLLILISMMIVSHIRSLRARTKKLEALG
jgi:hypothetical protein